KNLRRFWIPAGFVQAFFQETRAGGTAPAVHHPGIVRKNPALHEPACPAPPGRQSGTWPIGDDPPGGRLTDLPLPPKGLFFPRREKRSERKERRSGSHGNKGYGDNVGW